ncbi:DUF5388 domain-containing protein [Liquorilactobacillus vini]|uniref:DUF5388 domain-containing protein n=1 Tax=Liquorilactobacillus vini TaxID=238015 RepID=UPI00030D8DDC|nr:DUF5388 domain-containing protein [Liquorilactobacillus vini]
MSSLLNHKNDNTKKIDKNVEVKTKSITRAEAGFTDVQKDVIPTFDVSVRLDNHARNALLALAKTTAEKRTISEMLSIMIESYSKSLSENTMSAYNEYLEALEEKDKLAYRLKNRR